MSPALRIDHIHGEASGGISARSADQRGQRDHDGPGREFGGWIEHDRGGHAGLECAFAVVQLEDDFEQPGAFFGCGVVLWIVCAALIVFFIRRIEHQQTLPNRTGTMPESKAE